MALCLVGKKCGMTRLFDESGESIPVTVLEVTPNTIVQLKTIKNDGYRAAQVTTGNIRSKKVNKAMAGHFKKANVTAGSYLGEFRLGDDELLDAKVGDEFTVEQFSEVKSVDIRAISKGKGFAGVIKRHNFSMQDATHGNSLAHRAPGSIGQCQTPGRVFKGKKMAGQMGNVSKCVQNLQVVKIDNEKNVMIVKGAVPGAPGARVVIVSSVKSRGEK